ncbi:MAG: tetratricopeptide repeat protein [Ardenticatenaceae bacterium]|nr:tetratricopeptide repeat protein [Ardenticatenaceae bacterium]
MNHDVWIGHLSSNLAEAYFETGKIDLAEKFAYKAINSEHPTIPPYAIYTLGQIHAARNNFDLAEQAFQQGIPVV